jgi:hypothetical protein
MVRGKKSLLFILDVIIGFTILVIGLLLLLSYYYDVPISDQPSLYTQDLISFLTTTSFEDFHTTPTQDWLATGFVTDKMLVGEKLADFCTRNDVQNFTALMNATIQNEAGTQGLLPSYVQFYVRVLNNTEPESICLQYPTSFDSSSFNRSVITSTGRGLILYVNESYAVHNYTLEVAVW